MTTNSISEMPGRTVSSEPSDISLRNILVLMVCVLIASTEGYDVQAMAFAAPLLTDLWQLDTAQIGLLLTMSFVGIALGSLLLAPLGDRIGRKPSTLIGLAIAGTFTALAVAAENVPELIGTRVLAGLGLGLAMPNIVALALETAPKSWRIIAIVLVSCGYPLGAGVGGAIAGYFVVDYGYVAVFWVGAAATAAAILIGFFALPESPSFLARREPFTPAISDGALPPIRQSRIGALFSPERRTATLLLWLVNFAGVAMIYFMTSWLPTLLTYRGLSGSDAIMGTALFNGSGVVSGITFALLLRRTGPIILLGSAYTAAGLSTAALALSPPVGALFYILLMISGGSIIGAQFCLTAVVNIFYPAEIRVSGAGYALGVGRIGALFAPLIGAFVLATVSQVDHAFLIIVFPSMLGLLAVLGLWRQPGFTAQSY